MCASCLHRKENNISSENKNLKSITNHGLWILLCGNTPDLLCHVSQMYASTHRDKRTLGDFENKPSISLQEVFGRCQKNNLLPHFLPDVQLHFAFLQFRMVYITHCWYKWFWHWLIIFKNRMTKLLETHHMMVTLLSSF